MLKYLLTFLLLTQFNIATARELQTIYCPRVPQVKIQNAVWKQQADLPEFIYHGHFPDTHRSDVAVAYKPEIFVTFGKKWTDPKTEDDYIVGAIGDHASPPHFDFHALLCEFSGPSGSIMYISTRFNAFRVMIREDDFYKYWKLAKTGDPRKKEPDYYKCKIDEDCPVVVG